MLEKKPQRIAVLMGGWNGERPVSLTSGQECAKALERQGFEVSCLDITADVPHWVNRLVALSPDVVFMNALHGEWVEDGCIQGVLEMLGFPYTNSGVLSSALAMDKVWSRKLFALAQLPIPAGNVFSFKSFSDDAPMPFPFVMKPINQGSSLGVTIVERKEHFKAAREAWCYGDAVLIEDYIPGHEISVAVLGGKALGVLELRPKQGFYDYEAKYTDGKTDHIMPADMPADLYQEALSLAVESYKALGCQGAARVDLRFDDVRSTPGKLYVLEVNTQSGMTPLSIFPEIAAYQQISFEKLLEWMVMNPICPKENPHIKKYHNVLKRAADVDESPNALVQDPGRRVATGF